MGKVNDESLESQPGKEVRQIERVDADNSLETVTAGIDPEDDNESKEEKKEIKDISGTKDSTELNANKQIESKTEVIPDLSVVGNTIIIEEKAVEPEPKPTANSVDTCRIHDRTSLMTNGFYTTEYIILPEKIQ